MNNIDLSQIKLIVGLGNPGPKFSNTRHNIGAMVIQKLHNSEISQDLFIPNSFMNESGSPVAMVARKKGIKPNEILVIHDDIDLRPGEWKFKEAGGAGGHNGVRSLIEALGSDNFKRIRIGVGRPFPHKPTTPAEEEIISKYVLFPIPKEEKEKINEAISEILEDL